MELIFWYMEILFLNFLNFLNPDKLGNTLGPSSSNSQLS